MTIEDAGHYCPEGIDSQIISNDVGISSLDAGIIYSILELVAAGEDVSSFGDEAKRVIGNIGIQLANLDNNRIEEF